MYNKQSISDTITTLLADENTDYAALVKTIVNFVEEFPNKEILREAFQNESIDEMREKMGFWNYPNSTQYDTDSAIQVLVAMLTTASLTANQKNTLVRHFAQHFAEVAKDEDYCSEKVFIVIRNFGGKSDDNDLLFEYNSWQEAREDVDDRYIGCCDDVFIAEEMWLPILCQLNNQEFDEFKNFCSIVEFDAQYLEEIREDWEEQWENGEI